MRSIRIVHAAVAVALVAVALALPALASAILYCVNEPACVKAGGTASGSPDGAGLKEVLKAAETHAGSTVEIGPGTYSEEKGFTYDSAAIVTIRGAGRGSTVLSNGNKETSVFDLQSPGSTLAGLTAEIPNGKSLEGIELNGGTVEQVAITGGGGSTLTTGLSIDKGTFTNGSIAVDTAGVTSRGVEMHGGEVLDSTISGSYGVGASLEGTVRGCRITATVEALEGVYANPLIVEDTLIYGQGNGEALDLVANSNGSTKATLRGLTIVGATGTGAGIEVYAREGKSSTLTLEDSVIDNFEHPILEATEEAGSTISTTTDYSSYDSSSDKQETREEVHGGATLPGPPTDESPVAATPDFVHPVFGANGFTEGNWALLASSPLIGAGSPSSLAAGEYALDAAGNPRIVDGARDVGAYEYQRAAPVASASATPATVYKGQPVSFSGSASVIEPGDAIAGYQWAFDDGASVPAGAKATHAFATAGTHTATLTATDVVGVKATAVVSVVVTDPPRIPPPCTCKQRLRLIASLSVAPRAFRAGRTGASITSAPIGTRVSFNLAAKGHVTFTVERVLAGVVHGRSCVSPPHGSTHGKRCTRDVLVHGSFADAGVAGANTLRFTGRLHGHALAPGSYLLIATYSGGAGRASASAPFRIVG